MVASQGSLTPSLIRTSVPIIVALLVNKGVLAWTGIDDTTLSLVVAAVTTWLYYFAVRVLERASSTRWGWLLGYASAPAYPKPVAKLL